MVSIFDLAEKNPWWTKVDSIKIEGNKQSKDNYNHLINQIKEDLKQQLRGNRNFDQF